MFRTIKVFKILKILTGHQTSARHTDSQNEPNLRFFTFETSVVSNVPVVCSSDLSRADRGKLLIQKPLHLNFTSQLNSLVGNLEKMVNIFIIAPNLKI